MPTSGGGKFRIMCTQNSFSLQQCCVAGKQITVIKMTNAWVEEHTLYVYLKTKEQHYVLTASIKGLVVILGGGLYGNTNLLYRGT